jgi:uncharacterized membrane protein
MKWLRIGIFSIVLSNLAYAAPPSYLVTDLGSLTWATPIPGPGSLPGTEEYDRTTAGEVGSDTIQESVGPVTHAYLYRNQQLMDLGVLPGALSYTLPPRSIGLALNTAAHVVGGSDSAFYHSAVGLGTAAPHAVLWNGTINDLGTLSGDPGYASAATAINDFDEIVGNSEVTITNGLLANRAFVWIAGKMYNLTSYVAISYPNVRLTTAIGINCQGDIAALGYDIRTPNTERNYLLSRTGPRRNCP